MSRRRRGVVHRKPHTPDGFKSVFAMLDDLISWAPQQGFQGMLRRVGLQDVIQMECLGRNSSVLEVYNEHVLGRIYIDRKSTRLNSSHLGISYAVFCLKK